MRRCAARPTSCRRLTPTARPTGRALSSSAQLDARADHRAEEFSATEESGTWAVAQPAQWPVAAPPMVGRQPPYRSSTYSTCPFIWAGLNAVWAGLGFVVYPARFTEMFGAAWRRRYSTALRDDPVCWRCSSSRRSPPSPTTPSAAGAAASRTSSSAPLLDVVFLYGIAASNTLPGDPRVHDPAAVLVELRAGPVPGLCARPRAEAQVGLASGLMGVMIILGQVIGVGYRHDRRRQLGGNPFPNGTPEAGQFAQQAFFLPTSGWRSSRS